MGILLNSAGQWLSVLIWPSTVMVSFSTEMFVRITS